MIKISKSFRLDDRWYFGPVWMSETCLVLVVDRVRGRAVTPKTSAVFAAGVGLTALSPVVGIRLLSAYDEEGEIPPTLSYASLAELPTVVLENPEWPASLQRRQHRTALFVSKPATEQMHLSVWKGLRFRVGPHRLHLEINPFGCPPIRKALREKGWGV